jgi:plasmid maintenance system antidote protein VapI
VKLLKVDERSKLIRHYDWDVFFGMKAQFWPNLQARYDLLRAEMELGPRLDQEVRPHAA